MTRRIPLFAFIAFGLSACVAAGGAPLNYLSRTDYGQELSPPPAVHSPEWQRDVDAVIAAQQNYKPSDLIKAKFERDLRPEITAMALGKNFTRTSKPKTFALIDRTEKDCRSAVEESKVYWNTRRPYEMDPGVKILVPAHANRAYPSGHTACARVVADVLADLYPAKRGALMRRANEIARHRVLAGMHYPHDLTGGRELAALLYRDMQDSAQYQSDFAAARTEVTP